MLLLLLFCFILSTAIDALPQKVSEEEGISVGEGVVTAAAAISMNDNENINDENDFEKFLAKYNKLYASEEERQKRKSIFEANAAWVRQHNNGERGKLWQASLDSAFADLSFEEFAAKTGSTEIHQCMDHLSSSSLPLPHTRGTDPPPEVMDWREKGVLTPAKNDGKCGASYVFAAVANVESVNAIKTGVLVSLSEQQVLDCSSDFGTDGCKQGLPSMALQYIQHAGGLDSEDSYRYIGKTQKCKFSPSSIAANISAVVNITQNDEDTILQVVGLVSPVVVSMNTVAGFQFYKSGVFSDPSCATEISPLLHAVLAVGYGHDDTTGQDYWIMKNSFGPTWGDAGYFKIVRGANECVLAMCATYAVA